MFNNIAFDVVIGLVFVYLLYSLLATVVAEIIATVIGLRAHNLKEAVDRMLNDEDDEGKPAWQRLLDSMKLIRKPKSLMIRNFYNHPEIKYLGSTGIFKTPSSFKAISFSKTILYMLSGDGAPDKASIQNRLMLLRDNPGSLSKEEIILDKTTARYVLSLWQESYGDIVKFKLMLENWFDRTMEQALEWYKRKIQVVLIVLGFFMAWIFCADTFTIVDKLTNDKDAREKMVQMTSAYLQSHPEPPRAFTATQDSANRAASDSDRKRKLDSLLDVKRQLDADIADAHKILGLGGWLPDTIYYDTDTITHQRSYKPQVNEEALRNLNKPASGNKGAIGFSLTDKLSYLLWLFPIHFFGFLVTALAISLGAPFWFDLLNKMMKLRTSVKQPIRSPHNTADTEGVSPLNREG